MPKLIKPVTVVGLKRNPSGTLLTFSDGKTAKVQKLETVGWDRKLKEAPIILFNEKQFKNEVPKSQREAWAKADRAYVLKKEKEDAEAT